MVDGAERQEVQEGNSNRQGGSTGASNEAWESMPQTQQKDQGNDNVNVPSVGIEGDIKSGDKDWNMTKLEAPVYIGGERVKGQDMSDMGIDGKYYTNESGEVLKLQNGITVRVEDGKVDITNGRNAPKVLSSETNENGVQTTRYADGTVLTIDTTNGQMVSVQQEHKQIALGPDGRLTVATSYNKVLFRDTDGNHIQEPHPTDPDLPIKVGPVFPPHRPHNEDVRPTNGDKGKGS